MIFRSYDFPYFHAMLDPMMMMMTLLEEERSSPSFQLLSKTSLLLMIAELLQLPRRWVCIIWSFQLLLERKFRLFFSLLAGLGLLPISSSPALLSSYHHFSGWKVVQRQLFHPTFLSHGPFSIGSKRTKNCCKVSTILLASTGSNGFLLLIWFESKKSHHFVQLPPSNQPKENGTRKGQKIQLEYKY